MTIPLNPPCAILIPTRNRPAILRDSLLRLRAMGLDRFPLWVYDDASDDHAVIRQAVLDVWPTATVIEGRNHSGQALGRNVLLRACGREFAMLLDDDQYLLEFGNLWEHLDPARRDPRRAAVAFQCRDKADGRLDVPAGVGARPCATFMGGCVLFHVPSILAAGGYRSFWGYGYEEPELVARLYARGWHVWYDPTILVEHNHITTAEARRNEVECDFFYVRNVLLLASLNMPIWLGLPLGLARAIRRSFTIPRHPGTKLKAIAAGVVETFRHRKERTPMTARQSLAWIRFSRNWDRQPSPGEPQS